MAEEKMGNRYNLQELTEHDIYIKVGVGTSDAKLGTCLMTGSDRGKVENMTVYKCLTHALGRFVNKGNVANMKEGIEDMLEHSAPEDIFIALNYDMKNLITLEEAKKIPINDSDYLPLINDDSEKEKLYQTIIRVGQYQEFDQGTDK